MKKCISGTLGTAGMICAAVLSCAALSACSADAAQAVTSEASAETVSGITVGTESENDTDLELTAAVTYGNSSSDWDSSSTLAVTAKSGYAAYQWWINGSYDDSLSDYTWTTTGYDSRLLNTGVNSITVVVTDSDGNMYSESTSVTINDRD